MKINITNSLYSFNNLNNQTYTILTKKFFLNTYWLNIKKRLVYKDDSVLVLNSTKSYHFNFYKLVNFGVGKHLKSLRPIYLSTNNYLVSELLPFQILEFPFHKKVYDTFIFFIIFLLTNTYSSFKNDFTLKYSFVLKPLNFNLLFFLNRFYFLTYNY